MALCTWSDKFSVKNDRMDGHHRRLVSLMETLDEAIAARKGDRIVAPAIEELARYAAEHLKAEEALMEEMRYPDLERHRAMHHFFAKEIALLRSAYASGEVPRAKSIVQLLRDWFVYHIYNEDQKYGDILEGVRVRAA
ncbi:MAG TPA: bacteriohemerythrin [Geobacteraceae bacterium]